MVRELSRGIEAVSEEDGCRQMLIGMFIGIWESGVTLVSVESFWVLILCLFGLAANLSWNDSTSWIGMYTMLRIMMELDIRMTTSNGGLQHGRSGWDRNACYDMEDSPHDFSKTSWRVLICRFYARTCPLPSLSTPNDSIVATTNWNTIHADIQVLGP